MVHRLYFNAETFAAEVIRWNLYGMLKKRRQKYTYIISFRNLWNRILENRITYIYTRCTTHSLYSTSNTFIIHEAYNEKSNIFAESHLYKNKQKLCTKIYCRKVSCVFLIEAIVSIWKSLPQFTRITNLFAKRRKVTLFRRKTTIIWRVVEFRIWKWNSEKMNPGKKEKKNFIRIKTFNQRSFCNKYAMNKVKLQEQKLLLHSVGKRYVAIIRWSISNIISIRYTLFSNFEEHLTPYHLGKLVLVQNFRSPSFTEKEEKRREKLVYYSRGEKKIMFFEVFEKLKQRERRKKKKHITL